MDLFGVLAGVSGSTMEDAVSLPEGHAASHEIVGEVGGQHVAGL